MYYAAFDKTFYYLRKIFHVIITDKTWKYAGFTALLISFMFVIFNTSHAQSSTTTAIQSKLATCKSGTLQEPGYLIANDLVGDYCYQNNNYDLKTNLLSRENNIYPSTSSSSTSTTGLNNNDLNTYFRYGGAVSAAFFGGGAMYDFQPASVKDAVTYQANKIGVNVSAQVQGFNQFAPIVPLWSVFRDIALLLFVVVFVAIGFFILIQRRIGGQETVSLVSGLTNAAVAMVFITFSYAIGGIIVDIFSNVMNGVVATTFNGFINSQEILGKLNTVNSGVNVLTLMNELTNVGVSQSASNLFGTALTGLSYPANAVKGIFSNLNAGPSLFGVKELNVGYALGFFANTFVDILMGIITTSFNNSSIINAIVAFIIFIVMLRVVFALLGAYVSIVFKIMFAPFMLLPAALPGNGGKAIFGWVLSLIANALTFPAIFACILMAAMFLNLNANITNGTNGSRDFPSECKYVSSLNPGNASVIQGNQIPAKYFVVTRLGANDGNGSTKEQTACYPLVLPGKFNYWPAPIGYIQGVEPDDLIRFVIALAFIVLTPSVPKVLQSLLKVPQDNVLGSAAAGFRSGAGAFSGFISAIPSFGIGKALGNVTKSAADSAQ